LRDPQLERAVEAVKQIGRQWNLPDDAAPAALQGLDHCDAALDIDRGRCQRKDFGNTRASPTQRQAEEKDFRRQTLRRCDEAPALGGSGGPA